MRHRQAISMLGLAGLLAACGAGHATKPTASRSGVLTRTTSYGPATTSVQPSHLLPQVLVTDEAQNQLVVVDLPSGRIVRRIQLPPDPEDIATIGDGGVVVVVSSRAGKVTVLDRDTLRPIKTFGGFDEPHIVTISPDGQYAYVTDDVRGTVTVIQLSDMQVTSTVAVGSGAHHLSFSPDEHRLWIGLGESARQIAILDTTDPNHPRVIGDFDPGFPAHDLAFSPDGREVLVSSATGRDVTAFDPKTHRVLYRVAVGPPPQHIAFDGSYAYLTSGYGDTIEKVDARTGHVMARAVAPYGSFELAAAEGFVTTASLLRGTLAIYNLALRRLRVAKVGPATREVAISRP